MHPYLIQSVAAERTRELREVAEDHPDAVLAAGRHRRQRRAPGARDIVRLLPVRRRAAA